MQRFLIILGIIAVGYLAVNDTIDRFKELDRITVNTTPSQEEMKSEFLKTNGSGIQPKFQNNLPEPQNYELPKNRTERLKKETRENKFIHPKNTLNKNLN